MISPIEEVIYSDDISVIHTEQTFSISILGEEVGRVTIPEMSYGEVKEDKANVINLEVCLDDKFRVEISGTGVVEFLVYAKDVESKLELYKRDVKLLAK
jgi:hypothetical protein